MVAALSSSVHYHAAAHPVLPVVRRGEEVRVVVGPYCPAPPCAPCPAPGRGQMEVYTVGQGRGGWGAACHLVPLVVDRGRREVGVEQVEELELLDQELELFGSGLEAASEQECEEMFRSSSRDFLRACCGGAGAGDPRCALQPLLALLRRQQEIQVTTEQSEHEPNKSDSDISGGPKVFVVVHQASWAPFLPVLAVFSIVTTVFVGVVCHVMGRLNRASSISKVGYFYKIPLHYQGFQ